MAIGKTISQMQKKLQAKTPTLAAVQSAGGGGNFMSRAMTRINDRVAATKAANAVPAPAPAPAPVAAPVLTPQETQAAMVPGYDNSALAKLNAIGLSDEASPWMKLAEEKQRADEAAQLDLTAGQSAGAMAEARDALAMRGGLSGGAAENLAMRSMDNTLLGQQGVRSQGVTQRLGLGMDDANRKLGILQNLPGQNLNVWSEGMKAKGAQAMADAIRAGGSGSSPDPVKDPAGFAGNAQGGVDQAISRVVKPVLGNPGSQAAQSGVRYNPVNPLTPVNVYNDIKKIGTGSNPWW